MHIGVTDLQSGRSHINISACQLTRAASAHMSLYRRGRSASGRGPGFWRGRAGREGELRGELRGKGRGCIRRGDGGGSVGCIFVWCHC